MGSIYRVIPGMRLSDLFGSGDERPGDTQQKLLCGLSSIREEEGQISWCPVPGLTVNPALDALARPRLYAAQSQLISTTSVRRGV